jgi:hypothetical protein
MAASTIQGIGAHNFSIARRAGCDDVSGIEFGPAFAKRTRASLLVSPTGELSAVETTAVVAARVGVSVI